MSGDDALLPRHGGYLHLLSYRLADLIYDITVLFCAKYVPVSDRTNDQMIQSARSGFQNIAEGSVDSGVSKKSEIKLTGIAIGCLDELRKDIVKYLARRRWEPWAPGHEALLDLKQRHVKTLEGFREWVKDVWHSSGGRTPPDRIAANGTLTLLNLAIHLTRRQLASLESKFLQEGGITERMYRLRKEARDSQRKTRTDTDRHGPTLT
jgi:four helix bundle suffix protein